MLTYSDALQEYERIFIKDFDDNLVLIQISEQTPFHRWSRSIDDFIDPESPQLIASLTDEARIEAVNADDREALLLLCALADVCKQRRIKVVDLKDIDLGLDDSVKPENLLINGFRELKKWKSIFMQ